MKILITGGFGYLGGRLAQYLATRNRYEIVLGSRHHNEPPPWLPQAKVTRTAWESPPDLQAICSGVDVIVHLAGMNAKDCTADPVAALTSNGVMTARLLQAAVHQRVPRFVYLSSAHVYGSQLNGVVTEATCPDPQHPYATSHRAGEDVVRAAHERRDIEGIVIRLSNAYGAPAHAQANCWMLLVNDLCRQATRSKEMILHSSGTQRRDFITLTDACRAITHLLELPAEKLGDGLFNVGGASAPTIREMAERVGERFYAATGEQRSVLRRDDNDNDNGNGEPGSLDYRIDKLTATGFALQDEGSIGREIDGLIHFLLVNRDNQEPPAEVPVFRPLLEEVDYASMQSALRNGWLGIGGYVREFEKKLRTFLEAEDRFVVTTATGHAALHLALLRIGVGPGDEVITPALNNIADFQAIRACGAQPVFCDIDPVTLCIDPAAAEALVGPRTKVIIATDYACQLCDHDRLTDIAARHSVRLLHDAAHSLGSRYRGRMVGSFSDITMFSFDPVKTITTIDGGALVVRTEEDLQWLREGRLLGADQSTEIMYQNRRAGSYDVAHIGFRYHMSNPHAALGLSQLAKMERIRNTRVATARRYSEAFSGLSGLQVPATDFNDVVPFMYCVRIQADRRRDFRTHLAHENIDNGLHWEPGHWFSYLRDCRHGELGVTDQVASELVTLPLHSAMNRAEEDRVIHAIKGFFAR